MHICVCLVLWECGNCRSLKWGIYDGDDDDLLCYQTQIGYLLFYFYDHHLSSMISYPHILYHLLFRSTHLICLRFVIVLALHNDCRVGLFLFIYKSKRIIHWLHIHRAHTHLFHSFRWISSVYFTLVKSCYAMIAMRTLASNH